MKSTNRRKKIWVYYTDTSEPFQFGKFEQEQIPATIDQHKINIKTDIIDSDIPLLLSKSGMKKAQIQLNIYNNTIIFLG